MEAEPEEDFSDKCRLPDGQEMTLEEHGTIYTDGHIYYCGCYFKELNAKLPSTDCYFVGESTFTVLCSTIAVRLHSL